MKLSSVTNKFLTEMEKLIENSGTDVFEPLRENISKLRERLDAPLRVAIVGMGKTGKSTLFNAVLGEQILYTDALEATHTACWFKYGAERRLFVRFSDDTEREYPFDELEKWSTWKGRRESGEYIRRKWLVITYPSELLKVMDLLDTAGLNAATAENPDDAEDVQNTLELLKTAGIEAFIYTRNRVMQKDDINTLRDNGASPLNALGVLTRVDDQSRPGDSPVDEPEKLAICARYGAEMYGTLYGILPVAAKLAEGVNRLDGDSMSVLRRLAAADDETVRNALRVEGTFIKRGAADTETTEAERGAVIGLFGKNGLYLAVKAVREGMEGERLRAYMYAKSGVDKVRERVLQHFGNHAYLIRVNYVLNSMGRIIGDIGSKNRRDEKVSLICGQIKAKLNDWQLRDELEQLFKELSALRSYYSGGVTFGGGGAEEQFKQIMGEYGGSCEARLGFNGAATVRAMKEEALDRIGLWKEILNDVGSPAGLKKAADAAVSLLNEMRKHLDALLGYE